MAFSEFQYSNRSSIGSSPAETWTKEESVQNLTMTDDLMGGRQLKLDISSPQGQASARYSAYQRVRVIDRPSNVVIFLGRVTEIQNEHRKQNITLTCMDYMTDLRNKTVSTANLYGNRRSDIVKDVVSGGTEVGRGIGGGALNRIKDVTKVFTPHHVDRVVKVPSVGPGKVTGVSGNVITDSNGPFNNGHINRLIRRLVNTGGRKSVQWEGRITAVSSANSASGGFNEATVTATGVNTTLSGGSNYTGGHSFAVGNMWEVVGFEGKITKLLDRHTIEVATVGSTSSASYAGYKDANFTGWATNLGTEGGFEYFIESAEEGVFQATTGNAHTADKSIDYESRVTDSPYLEYVRRAYGQGKSSQEGLMDTINRLGRDEIWETPNVLFFGGHFDAGLGITQDEWHIMTSEANTGIDVMYKPTDSFLPLMAQCWYTSNQNHYPVRAYYDSSVNDTRVYFRRPDANTAVQVSTINTAAAATGSAANSVSTWDAEVPERNRIQVGDEVRRVDSVGSDHVNIDRPLSKNYAYTDAVIVGVGRSVGTPRWDKASGIPIRADTRDSDKDLVTDGTFYNGANSGWTIAKNNANADTATVSYSNHNLEITTAANAANGEGFVYQELTGLVVGKRYVVSVDVSRFAGNTTGWRRIRVGSNAANNDLTWNTTTKTWGPDSWDSAVALDNAVSNDISYSEGGSNWVRYSFEFIAANTVGTISLGAGSTTKITAGIDDESTTTAIPIENYATYGFSVNDVITIDSEDMIITGLVGTAQLNVTRAHNSTTIADHTQNAAVYLKAGGKKARFDNVSVRRKQNDSKLYVGSPNIFTGIKFDMDESPDAFKDFSIEFWGRNHYTGRFGWWALDKYSHESAQGNLIGQQTIVYPDEAATDGLSRGIARFNQTGIIKWSDIALGFSSSSPVGQTAPNRDWNHWTKNNLMTTEPEMGAGAINTIADAHNFTGKGGKKITSLADPELSNLYWIRLSCARDEYNWTASSSEHPGYIRNIRILDGRTDSTNTSSIATRYDTMEKKLPYAKWDWRLEDPEFFSVVAKSDMSSPSTTLNNGQNGIDHIDESWTLASTANLTPSHTLRIENEELRIRTLLANNAVVATRGVNGTSAVAHSTADEAVTSFHTWDDYTKDMTNRSTHRSMDGFDQSFSGEHHFMYFGADYKFSGIEFNLSQVGTTVDLQTEYWNGYMWVAIKDLNGYNFTASGSIRWDMEAIEPLESLSAQDGSYFSSTKWVKRDLRAASRSWGGYNYTYDGSSSSGIANPYQATPTTTQITAGDYSGDVANGDVSGTDYPGGIDYINNIEAPHHHLYWVRVRTAADSAEDSAHVAAKISTIRMFSKASVSYFERGTKPWNFNITGTDADINPNPAGNAAAQNTEAKHSMEDSNGQFLRSPASGNVWVKNTAAADTTADGRTVDNSHTTLSASRLGQQPALTRGGTGGTNGLQSEFHKSVYLQAGLFIKGNTDATYAGRDASKYLMYHEPKPGLKTYDTYGGDSAWHGMTFTYKAGKTAQVSPIYRYAISEVPAEMLTRVTVHGKSPISFTAIDEEAESTYGIRQEKVVYDKSIEFAAEAETSAEGLLAQLKPLSNQTIKKAMLEVYDYPVYTYNSATSTPFYSGATEIDRGIPRPVRAGDMIKITIDDGNYSLTNEPFLVQSITYDDKKGLAKLTCTQGIHPASTMTDSPWADNYNKAVEARNTAQEAALPTTQVVLSPTNDPGEAIGTETVDAADHPAEHSKSNKTKWNASSTAPEGYNPLETENLQNSGTVSKNFVSTSGYNPRTGGLWFEGDHRDIQLPATVAGSGLNIIKVDPTNTFVTRDGGFSSRIDWANRTLVQTTSPQTFYNIKNVIDKSTIEVSGDITWGTGLTNLHVRRISSILNSPSVSSSAGVIYYDSELGLFRTRTNAQVYDATGLAETSNPSLAQPFWGSVMSGFHGVKAASSSGEVTIKWYNDHGWNGSFKHKPMVIATVDPTDLTGIDDTAVLPIRGWVQVKGFYDASNNPSIAQFGVAGSNSTGNKLYAQNNDATVSEFNNGINNRTIHRLDESTLELLESGTVLESSTASSHYITTSGISGWTPAKDRYVIDASIVYVKLQIHLANITLNAATSSATESFLLSQPVGSAYAQGFTSDTAGQVRLEANSVPYASMNNAKPVAVHYMIIPQTNVPIFQGTTVNGVSGTGSRPIRNIPFYGEGGNSPYQ